MEANPINQVAILNNWKLTLHYKSVGFLRPLGRHSVSSDRYLVWFPGLFVRAGHFTFQNLRFFLKFGFVPIAFRSIWWRVTFQELFGYHDSLSDLAFFGIVGRFVLIINGFVW
jgi:hypothetical protein